MEDNEKIEYEEQTSKRGNEVPLRVTIPELIPMEVEVIDSDNMLNSLEKEKENEESIKTTKEATPADMDDVADSMDIRNIISQKSIEPEKPVQVNNEIKQRRGAATRALEKIAEWTRNLLTLL